MLQQEKPDDYVIATGKSVTVRELCRLAFVQVGLNYQDYVVIDPKLFRPAEVDILFRGSNKSKKAIRLAIKN